MGERELRLAATSFYRIKSQENNDCFLNLFRWKKGEHINFTRTRHKRPPHYSLRDSNSKAATRNPYLKGKNEALLKNSLLFSDSMYYHYCITISTFKYAHKEPKNGQNMELWIAMLISK